MNVKDIRRSNMRALCKSVGGIRAMAKVTGKSQSQMSQLIGINPTKNIGDRIAATVEKVFKKPSGWLDGLNPGVAEPEIEYQLTSHFVNHQPVPLVTWEQAKKWLKGKGSELPKSYLRMLAATSDTSNKSIALEIDNDTMENSVGTTFPVGSIIIIDTKADVYNGAYVIAKLPDGNITFKQYIQDGSHYFLKPLNPRYSFIEIPSTSVIVGVVRQLMMEFP
ncbi:MAG: S24 family peptidase [Proteobacteria bacterium]|nr:S24 family peptidase [Pseudomonadota bacterium]